MNHTLLAPASLLPYFDEWRCIMEELPEPNVLVILPASPKRARGAACKIVEHLRLEGCEVIALPAERLAGRYPSVAEG